MTSGTGWSGIAENIKVMLATDTGGRMKTGDDASKADYKAKAAEKMRKWRAANPQTPEQKAKAGEKSREWRQANKERSKANTEAWRVANLDRRNAIQRAYKARKKAAAEGLNDGIA